MKNIEIYSTPICRYCKDAKEFFKEHNVEYTEKDVFQNKEFLNEMVSKSGQMITPVIDIDGQIIVGFDEDKLRELLEIK